MLRERNPSADAACLPCCSQLYFAFRPIPYPPQADPLPSWNDGAPKQSIIDFVVRVTTRAAPISCRSNSASPPSTTTARCGPSSRSISSSRSPSTASRRWRRSIRSGKTTEPFRRVLAGDVAALAAIGEKGLLEIVAATHAGMTVEEFGKTVLEWLATARHPRFKRPYTDLVYQPMLELLAYLRANGFKTFIVSGGGIEFMRPWTEKVYGIPPEQVVGSSGVTQVRAAADGKPVLIKDAKVEFIDDGPGKPVGINRFIGRRPVFAFGNSDGDQQMLEWTAAGAGARFMGARPSHRRRARIRLRPQVARSASSTRRGTRRSGAAGWSST